MLAPGDKSANWRGRPKYRRDIPTVFRELHPAVDTSVLVEAAMNVK
jgi:hypothetical protein